MYINRPSVTKIEAADRVYLLRSTSCKFEQYEFQKPGQMLVSLSRYVLSDTNETLDHFSKPRLILKQLCM